MKLDKILSLIAVVAVAANAWVQSIEIYQMDDTAMLMVVGPSFNGRNGKLVGGARLGASFVVETEEGQGCTTHSNSGV